MDWDRDVGRVGDVEDEDGRLRRRGWFRGSGREEPGTEVVLYRGRYFSVQRSETVVIAKLESFRGN